MGRSHLHGSRIIQFNQLPSCSCALPVNLNSFSSFIIYNNTTIYVLLPSTILQNLSNFGKAHCHNSPFIFCFKCGTIAGAMGPLHNHVQGKPHCIVKSKLLDLLSARPDLNAIVNIGPRLPMAWPDDLRPVASLPVQATIASCAP
jgi:hypothetical protein